MYKRGTQLIVLWHSTLKQCNLIGQKTGYWMEIFAYVIKGDTHKSEVYLATTISTVSLDRVKTSKMIPLLFI